MNGDDAYLSQDYLTSTEGVLAGLERVATFLGEEGLHAKATYVDRAIEKIKELDRKLKDNG